jgi:hypothetical protein
MDLTEYYEEVVKTAGLVGPSEEETKEALAALEAAAEGDESIDVDAVEEVLKTAGLLEDDSEEESSEEKIAAIVAVAEQFDIDGIAFEDDDEKIAAAQAIVDGFEKVAKNEPGTARTDPAKFSRQIQGQMQNKERDRRLLAGIDKKKANEAQEAKARMDARKAKIGEKGTMKRFVKAGPQRAKDLLRKADTKLHGMNQTKRLGMTVQNWRRAGTAGIAAGAIGGGAAYLKSRKNK